MGRLSEALAQFDGDTYSPVLDHKRLTGQLERVHAFMSDGQWHSLASLAFASGGSEAGVSARIRDMRKQKFGGHIIGRRRVGTSGLFQYRMVS